jgi:hypothetical protein
MREHADGIHIVWLTNNARSSAGSQEGIVPKDVLLGRIGPNMEEWRSLYFGALHADTGPLSPGTLPLEFVGHIPGFPMLSRINGLVYDAVFSAEDVKALGQECLRLQMEISGQAAIALEKIEFIAKVAAERSTGIIFEGE